MMKLMRCGNMIDNNYNGNYVDLHIHTTASDGSYSPKEVVDIANKEGLSAIAVTDHNTVDGIPEALDYGNKIGLKVIPGIELTVNFNQITFHLLGLMIDYRSDELKNYLIKYHRTRVKAFYKMSSSLERLSVSIPYKEIENRHYSLSYLLTYYKDHLNKNQYRKVENEILTSNYYSIITNLSFEASIVIDMLHHCGGKSILAHLSKIDLPEEKMEYLLQKLKVMGLDGIEVWHPLYSQRNIETYKKWSEKYHFIKSGGSDFHGDLRKNVYVGQCKVSKSILDAFENNKVERRILF